MTGLSSTLPRVLKVGPGPSATSGTGTATASTTSPGASNPAASRVEIRVRTARAEPAGDHSATFVAGRQAAYRGGMSDVPFGFGPADRW